MSYTKIDSAPVSTGSAAKSGLTANPDHTKGSETTQSCSRAAHQYVDAGLGLVEIVPKTKKACGSGWQKPVNAITDLVRAQELSGGVGLHHLASRTCAVDVDDWSSSEVWFAERGIDLAALFANPNAVQIQSGREGRGKLLFRLPDSVDWMPYVMTASGKLELRCANGPESSQSDVLPPSIHPHTGKPYAWKGDWRFIPVLPDALLTIWLTAAGQSARKANRPKVKAEHGVIGAFNAAYRPGDILERHGYSPTTDDERWQYPDSTTGTAGVVRLPDTDPPRVYSHHSADPLADGYSHDAFSTFTVLDHHGDMKAALRAAGADVGDAPVRSFDALQTDAAAFDPTSDADALQKLIIEASTLPAIKQRRVLDTLKQQTGMPLSTLQAAACDQARDEDVDHLTLARQVQAGVGADNVLASDGFVWCWHEAGVWRPAEPRAVRGWVQKHVAGSGEQVTKSLIDSVSDLFTTEVYRPEHEFNVGNPEMVNTPSGELMLEAGVWALTPHRRENYRTTQIPVAYNPAATAPRFLQFLKEIFPDGDGEQKAKAVLEMMGYTLMAHSRHERFVILVGAGANGKSVLLNVLEALCGYANVAGVQPSQFGNKFQRAHLHLKLANIVTEVEQGAVIDDAALKGITSGEPSTVEHKFRDPFQMRPFATCWFGTNHMPHTRDFSDALFRRSLVLQFNAVFKPEHGNHDPNLAETLHAELPGILNLSLSCYARALHEGFTTPESSKEAREEWRLEADQVAQFIEAECQRVESGSVVASTLFKRYREWATENGIYRTLSMKGFRDRLTRLGLGSKRTRTGRFVTGVQLMWV